MTSTWLPYLLTGLLEVSAGCGLLALLMIVCAPLIRKYFAPQWNVTIWCILGMRLLIPITGWDFIRPLPSGSVTVVATILLLVWAIGFAFTLAGFLATNLRFKREALRWSEPASDARIHSMLASIAKEMEIATLPEVRVGIKASSPMLFGLSVPILLLPHEQYSATNLGLILTHELYHLKRRDLLHRALMMVVCSMHWFNPAVWMLLRASCTDMERACDFDLLEHAQPEMRNRYYAAISHTLHAPVFNPPLLSTAFYGGSRVIGTRLRGILDIRVKQSGRLALCGVLAALLCTIGVAAHAANGFGLPHVLFAADPAILETQAPAPQEPEPAQPASEPQASSSAPERSFEISSSEASSSEVSSSEASSSEVSSSETSSSEVSSSETSSSEVSSSETSSSEVSSSEASSSEASSAPQDENGLPLVPANGAKPARGAVPDESAFLPGIQLLLAQYADGTADTSMKDPDKPLLMPLPTSAQSDPVVNSVEDFSVSYNQQIEGYGVVVPFDNGQLLMHIWVTDVGPADAYQFSPAAVSFQRVDP